MLRGQTQSRRPLNFSEALSTLPVFSVAKDFPGYPVTGEIRDSWNPRAGVPLACGVQGEYVGS